MPFEFLTRPIGDVSRKVLIVVKDQQQKVRVDDRRQEENPAVTRIIVKTTAEHSAEVVHESLPVNFVEKRLLDAAVSHLKQMLQVTGIFIRVDLEENRR